MVRNELKRHLYYYESFRKHLSPPIRKALWYILRHGIEAHARRRWQSDIFSTFDLQVFSFSILLGPSLRINSDGN